MLTASDESHALGGHLCSSENSRARSALMSRVVAPEAVVSDGGDGFAKALREAWPTTRRRRCVFHDFCQVQGHATTRPRSQAGVELYGLARALLSVTTLRGTTAGRRRCLPGLRDGTRFCPRPPSTRTAGRGSPTRGS